MSDYYKTIDYQLKVTAEAAAYASYRQKRFELFNELFDDGRWIKMGDDSFGRYKGERYFIVHLMSDVGMTNLGGRAKKFNDVLQRLLDHKEQLLTDEWTTTREQSKELRYPSAKKKQNDKPAAKAGPTRRERSAPSFGIPARSGRRSSHVMKIPYSIEQLSYIERRWHTNYPPPLEQLYALCRYDADADLLVYIDKEGMAQYEEAVLAPTPLFIELGGRHVARWRIVSMFLYGNPHGVKATAKQLAELADIQARMTGVSIAASRDAAVAELGGVVLPNGGDVRGPNYREKHVIPAPTAAQEKADALWRKEKGLPPHKEVIAAEVARAEKAKKRPRNRWAPKKPLTEAEIEALREEARRIEANPIPYKKDMRTWRPLKT